MNRPAVVASSAVIALCLFGPAKAQNVSGHCPGHDGPIVSQQALASGTAHWDTIDFDVAKMSNVNVVVTTSEGRLYLQVEFDQIQPQGFLNSHLFGEMRGPNPPTDNHEIPLFGIYGAKNRPDPATKTVFGSNIPLAPLGTGAAQGFYLSIDCNAITDPTKPPPPQVGFWFNLNCDSDQKNCWLD